MNSLLKFGLCLLVAVMQSPSPMDKELSREAYMRTSGSETGLAGLGAFVHIAEAASVPMGVEYEPVDGQMGSPAALLSPQLFSNPLKVSDALRLTVERLPQYEVATRDGIITVAPKQLIGSSTHFLNRPLKKFEVKNVTLIQAVWKLRQTINKDYLPWDANRFKNSPLNLDWLNKKVSLKAEGATPREILNRLAALHGEVIWTVSYPSQVGRAPAIEEAAMIRLVPFPGRGSIFSLAPFRGRGAPGISGTRGAPTRGTSTRGVVIGGRRPKQH